MLRDLKTGIQRTIEGWSNRPWLSSQELAARSFEKTRRDLYGGEVPLSKREEVVDELLDNYLRLRRRTLPPYTTHASIEITSAPRRSI